CARRGSWNDPIFDYW
nr:immunoglobulin heavy chain junction region [Macaca mulatta]